MTALARTAGFLRSELSHRLDLYSVPQLHFVYDDSIERGMRLSQLIDDAVAADKKLDELGMADASAPPRRRVDGVLLLDKPSGLIVERRAAAREAAVRARKRPGTPARSIRSPPACCRSASARRPSSRSFLLDAPKRYRATVRFGVATTTQDAEGEVVETRPVAIGAAQIEPALPAFIGAHPPGAAARISALKYAGAATTSTRARASRFRAPSREVEIDDTAT